MESVSCPYISSRSSRSRLFLELSRKRRSRHFLFLDRDGVINRDIGTYILDKGMLHLLDNAIEAIVKAFQNGWIINICTNQPGIGKGLMTHEDLDDIHAYMRSCVEEKGGVIGEMVYCIHPRDYPCHCRKPNAGMLSYLAQFYDMSSYEIKNSWFVGDHERDLLASLEFGCRFARIVNPESEIFEPRSSYPVFPSLMEFVNYLIEK